MKIESIKDYCRYMNDNLTCHKIEIGTTQVLKTISEQETDENIKRNLNIEILVCDFEFDEGKNQPVYSTTYNDGTVYEYPSYSGITPDDYDYLQSRAASVTNDYLIARYNHILWNSPREHNQKQFINVKNAIEAYYRIVSAYTPSPDKVEYEYFEIFKNGFALALSVKHMVDEFKALYKKWIFEPDSFGFDMKIILLRHLSNLQQLDKTDFKGALDFLLKCGKQKLQQGVDAHWASDIFAVGLKIAQRTGQETNSWNEHIGDSYVAMALNRKNDDTGMVTMEFYRNAVLYYKAAGATEKVDDTETTLDAVRSKLKMANISIPMSEEEIQILKSGVDEIVQEILEKKSEEIYKHLMFDPRLFPTKNSIENISKGSENSFLKFAHTIKFDNNNNISKAGEETDKDIFFRNYGFRIKYNLSLLHKIFLEGFKRGKLNYNTLIEYLKKNSWYAQTLATNDNGGDIVNYNWISVIAPSLQNFFLQFGTEISSPELPSNYVLPIDSLTLKVEGVIREIAKFCKVPTMAVGREGVMRQRYIEDLLSEEPIIEFLGENNIVFLQYFFTTNGQNIRNNVAHAFYRFNNYSPIIMMLLICTFLKLGNFKLKDVSTEVSEEASSK